MGDLAARVIGNDVPSSPARAHPESPSPPGPDEMRRMNHARSAPLAKHDCARHPAHGHQHLTAGRRRHAFTVDLEDWFDGLPIDPDRKAKAERRLRRGLDPLLEALSRHGALGTFFVLGPVARSIRGMREIVAAGHEVGCHGWSHDLLYEMTPARLREETQRACEVIGEITGQQVRAPGGVLLDHRRSLWALDVLAALGIEYDSSIFPARNWRYGIPDDPRPQRIETAGPIYELPLSVRRVVGQLPLPAARTFASMHALSRANIRAAEREGRIVFYLHPWELDPDHPRVLPLEGASDALREPAIDPGELERLLDEFAFATLGEVVEHEVRPSWFVTTSRREAQRFDAIYEERKPLGQRAVDTLFRRVVVERFRLITNLAPRRVTGPRSTSVVGPAVTRSRSPSAAPRVLGVDVAASMVELGETMAAGAGLAGRAVSQPELSRSRR